MVYGRHDEPISGSSECAPTFHTFLNRYYVQCDYFRLVFFYVRYGIKESKEVISVATVQWRLIWERSCTVRHKR